MDMLTLMPSSTVLTTGAPTPIVVALMTGRALAFTPCTASESRMPATTGTQALLLKNSDGLFTVTVSDEALAPNTRPPAVGRTTVCTMSLMWSTTGSLSATTSITRSAPTIASTTGCSSQRQDSGSEMTSV
jgi:hypothetical protein